MGGERTKEGRPERMEWVDELRTFAIVLVVNMHACVTYSHVGSWYVNDGPGPSEIGKLVFVLWQAHLQSFFMGILFLLGGYFAQGAIARKGVAAFLKERVLRLGVPSLFYMVVLNPFINLVINPGGYAHASVLRSYLHYLAALNFLGGSGPMWFAVALLFFCFALAGVNAIRPVQAAPQKRAPGIFSVALVAAVLGVSTFLVRTVQPIGSSVMNMQLCFFPQYVLAFAIGVAASRGAWLQALARSALARRAGWAGIILGPLALTGTLVAAGILRGADPSAVLGGWNWDALRMASWEQVTGTLLALGALSFCSGKLDTPTPVARWLGERSFGVYLFHPVVLVLVTVALRPYALDPFMAVAVLTGLGLVGSYGIADLARRVPGLRPFL